MREREIYYSMTTIAKKLNINRQKLSQTIQQNNLTGIIRKNNRVFFPEGIIPRLKKIIGFNDKYNPEEYKNLTELTEELKRMDIKAARDHTKKWMNNNPEMLILHLGRRYVHIDEVKDLISFLLDERTIPFGYYTLKDAANETGFSTTTITNWCNIGCVSFLYRIKDGSRQLVVKISDISAKIEVGGLPQTLHPPPDLVTVSEASTILECSDQSVRTLIKGGAFPNFTKGNSCYLIPLVEIKEFIAGNFCTTRHLSETLNCHYKVISTIVQGLNTRFVIRKGSAFLISKNAIPEIKSLLGYNDKFNSNEYNTTLDIQKELSNKGVLTKGLSTIHTWLKKYKVQPLKHLNINYYHKQDVKCFISNLIEERSIPEGYLPIDGAADKSKLHIDTLADWCSKKKIESIIRIIKGNRRKLVKWSDIEKILENGSPKDLADPTILNVKQASELLESSKDEIRKLIKIGELPNARNGICFLDD